MAKELYSVKEAAKLLDLDFSDQDLYYFLKMVEIVDQNRRPREDFIRKGILVEERGTKNVYSKELFYTTKFTKKGLVWLLEDFRPDILILLHAEETLKA